MRILLFDDLQANRQEVKQAILQVLGKDDEIQEFEPLAGGLKSGTYEVRLEKDLSVAPNVNVHLIVADRDLSGYTGSYPGLSESTVRRVADDLGIPECGYARGDEDVYLLEGKRREACIRLRLKPTDVFAIRVKSIAEDFIEIGEKLQGLAKDNRIPPGKLLAAILGKPEYADKISLYASGDQNRWASVMQAQNKPNQTQRIACLMGYWLWDSVLRYPGVTVGEAAASSYLNIRHEIFKQDKHVQGLFASARYKGPFAAAKIAMWWRGMLDDIVAESGCRDGREFASKMLGSDVPASQCCDDSSIAAGFFCMIKQKPVSLKNSQAGLPWFPRGADLARVSKSAFDELGPWL